MGGRCTLAHSRSRRRKLLEDVYSLTGVPMSWISNLPAPKDAITALWALKQIPSSQRMIKLQEVDKPCEDDGTEMSAKRRKQFDETLLRIADSRKWTLQDADFFMKVFHKPGRSLREFSGTRSGLVEPP